MMEGTKFELMDAEYKIVEGNYKIWRVLWERMDPNIWHALQSTPEALLRYVANCERPKSHGPYGMTIRSGNSLTMYLIGANNLLSAEPLEISLGDRELPGNSSVSIENTPNGKRLMLNGQPMESFLNLTAKQKRFFEVLGETRNVSTIPMYSLSKGAVTSETRKNIEKINKFVGETQKITWEKRAHEFFPPGTPENSQRER